MQIVLRAVFLILVILGGGLFDVGNTMAAEKGKAKAGSHNKVTPVAKRISVRPVVRTKTHLVVVTPHNARLSKERGRLSVNSGAALVVYQNGGDALFQKNAHTIAPIASITKLMTAMVVLDSEPSLKARITITGNDVDYLRGSRSRLAVGSVMTRETALLLALMSSENRAAHALGRHYPGGMLAFLAAMNVKAQSLGMRDSHFEDPTGLTSNNVSTPHDLARMVEAAYKYPLIRELTTTAEASVDIGGREMLYRNTNPLVKNSAWDVGLSKTGYIHEAGKCLVMQARVADRPVVIVLLDSVGKLTRIGDANRIKRWLESLQASNRLPERAVLSRANNFELPHPG